MTRTRVKTTPKFGELADSVKFKAIEKVESSDCGFLVTLCFQELPSSVFCLLNNMINLRYAAACGLLVAGLASGRGALAQSAGAATAATPPTSTPPTNAVPLAVDNFEEGVGAWTHNDKTKSGLSEIAAISPGVAATSKQAALLTFKSANGSWASLSRPVDGAAWARIGARELVFSLNGSGDLKGVDLQLRAKTENGDIVYSLPLPVKINNTTWRTVVVPLASFKNAQGQSVVNQMNNVYLLQFAQTGDWNSRFFKIDEMLVRGSGTPVVAKATPAAPVAASGAPALPTGAVAVNVDFLRVAGNIRASANVSVLAPYDAAKTQSLELSPTYREALATLRPKYVRLDVAALADLADSSRPAFSYTRLVSAARRVRTVGAEPLIAISNPNEWGLDARGYGVLAAGAARALNPRAGSLARYFELAAWSSDLKSADAVKFYNAGYSGIKNTSGKLIVGGYGAPAGDVAAQNAILRGAKGLDFLSSRFFAASSGAPSDTALIDVARTIPALKTAAGLLDKSRFKRAPLFVTSANISSAHNAGDFVPSDSRLIGQVSGAWWAQFMGSGSRLADQIFHNDATNPEWGLLLVDTKAQAFPSYYAMYLWNTYFGNGTQRVVADSKSDAIYAAATNTKTAHNLLLVNTTALPQVAQVGIRGFPTLRQVRIHTNDDPSKPIRTTNLPNSPFQTLKLPAYSVNVVQFIEPPK